MVQCGHLIACRSIVADSALWEITEKVEGKAREKEFTTDTDSEWRCSLHGSVLIVVIRAIVDD